jgi:hypothetical protein
MSAVIVDLSARRVQHRSTSLQDSVTQAVMDTFKNYPVAAVAIGIGSALVVQDRNGSFMSCMDAAEKTITDYTEQHFPDAEALRNNERMIAFYQRRARRIAAFQSLIERQIRAQLSGRSETEVSSAVTRAHRVLAGGGTLGAAMCHAIGDDHEGSAC